jgi:hypothetical protein
MSDPLVLESRLASLEAKVASLEEIMARGSSKTNWLQIVVGAFENEHDFGEVLKLGRMIRESDRPADDSEGTDSSCTSRHQSSEIRSHSI